MFALRGLAAAAAAGLCILAGAPALANCELKAYPLPVTMVGLQPRVSAKVNGADAAFILDSGSFFNTINPDLVKSQKMAAAGAVITGSRLPIATGGFEVRGIGGEDGARAVTVRQLEIGGASFANLAFVSVGGYGDAAGLLGQNLLRLVDVEYDLPNKVVRLTTPKGCGQSDLAYWVGPSQPYSILPLERPDQGDHHTYASVWINGVKLKAMLDTGSYVTMISAHAAALAGVKVGDPGVERVGDSRGIGRRAVPTWTGRFARVKVGDEEIQNTRLSIADSDLAGADMLLGADFFLSHRVYVANSQGKLYFTYTGGPVFTLTGPAPTPAAQQTANADPAAKPGAHQAPASGLR